LLAFHATAKPNLKQLYDLTVQFLRAAITVDTTAPGNPQLSQLAVPLPVVPEDNNILQWAMARFAVYNLLPNEGNQPMQHAIMLAQLPPQNQQQQATQGIALPPPVPLGGGRGPAPQQPPYLPIDHTTPTPATKFATTVPPFATRAITTWTGTSAATTPSH